MLFFSRHYTAFFLVIQYLKLVFQNNRRPDDGFYTCIISNEYGSINHTIQVREIWGTKKLLTLLNVVFCCTSTCSGIKKSEILRWNLSNLKCSCPFTIYFFPHYYPCLVNDRFQKQLTTLYTGYHKNCIMTYLTTIKAIELVAYIELIFIVYM